MTENEQLAGELRAATYVLRNLYRLARNPAAAIDRLGDVAKDIDKVAARLHERPKSPPATVSPGRLDPGTIAGPTGRMVRVERRVRVPRRTAA